MNLKFWRRSQKTAAHFLDVEEARIRIFEKKCKHRAVSMDKSCPVVGLGNSKSLLECFFLYVCGACGCVCVCATGVNICSFCAFVLTLLLE